MCGAWQAVLAAWSGLFERRPPGRAERLGVLVRDAVDDHLDALAGEGEAPGEHLVHDGGERELIGARVDLARAARLLGRHVLRRAEQHALAGERDRGGAHLRDPEVAQLHVLLARPPSRLVGSGP